MGFGWKNLCMEIWAEKCITDYSILPNKDKCTCLTATLTVYFSISIYWIYTGIDASKCAYCEVFDGPHHIQLINIFKNPINQRVSQMHQIHTSYFVNAQNYDFSNRNWVGPGPISTYETHTQSHITICLIRCKISSVSYKNKQADPGCPAYRKRQITASRTVVPAATMTWSYLSTMSSST